MDFKVKQDPVTPVEIGDPNQSVVIKVTPPATGAPKVRVTITVGCDNKPADLVASPNDLKQVTWEPGGSGDPKMDPVPNPPEGKKVWNTGGFPTGLPVSITLGPFVSNAPPGEADITVLVQTSKGPNRWSDGETHHVNIKKNLGQPDIRKIRNFSVNPSFIRLAGQTPVTVSFSATGYTKMTLSRNNEEVRNWVVAKGKKFISGVFPVKGEFPEIEKPSISSVYRLVGTYAGQDGKEESDPPVDRIVQVISRGWNRIALPQGSPVRLFFEKGGGAGGSDQLSGIFKSGKDDYALYSSQNGLDTWEPQKGKVPKEMATSPGVYYNGKLWLIGGSSVDPGNPRNEVRCYEAGEWKLKTVASPQKFTSRMGHACVALEDGNGILAIGGYNADGGAFQDVWSLKENSNGDVLWEQLVKKCPWEARVNPAAVTLKLGKSGDQVWIYGGSKTPQGDQLPNDFWTTTDGKQWKDMSKGQDPPIDKRPVPIMPDPGAPVGSALVAFPRTDPALGSVKSDQLALIGSFLEVTASNKSGNRIFSYMFEWHPGTALWEGRPVSDGWQQFQGQNFYMQGIVFNDFLYCWSLEDDEEITAKLNILVSH